MRVVFDRTRNAPFALEPYGASTGDLFAFLMDVTDRGTRSATLLIDDDDAWHFLPGFKSAAVGIGFALYIWQALSCLHVDAFYYGFTWDWDELMGFFLFIPAEA